MVVSLGPGKFYGSSLPRPRIYTDVKFNTERVDPPVSVVDPLLSWAHDAHWSMGGLSTKRLRLQGRIEGNITKLRAENEKLTRKKKLASSVMHVDVSRQSASPPPAPSAAKRKRRFLALIEEEEEPELEEEEARIRERKRPARKLINEFNSVAAATRSSPRSSGDLQRSKGGSFVSRMQKASENLVMNKSKKKSTPTIEPESQTEVDSKSNSKLQRDGDKSRGSPSSSLSSSSSRVRTSPRLMKNKKM